MQDEMPEIARELNDLLSQVKGVTGVSEEVTLSYIVQIESEDDRENVEKVGITLKEQARQYGLDVEVIPVTPEEVETAKKKLEEHLAKQN